MAKLVSAQKGIDFIKGDYDRLNKVYSIWVMLNPAERERNTAVRYTMRAENLAGDENRRMPVLDTFNIIFINVGDYKDDLPKISAFPAALFSKEIDEERHNLIENRFNIVLNDSIVEEVNRLTSIRQDVYEWGFDDGKDEGIIKGKIENSIDIAVRLVKEEGWSKEKALSFIKIPEGHQDLIEKEFYKRLT